ncbi:Hypothetical protein NTJ_02196 [Nesidiocoris tenuis]|uniref:Zasp-like motif domain-containing protein n=1 Tax=Nesidiocoris tenuis TaxID=355587 RepID=A0ABN7ADG3_9HEMI|nr:Hypothetical protein NTJ_02196 [Nesidiocoris tenuis]
MLRWGKSRGASTPYILNRNIFRQPSEQSLNSQATTSTSQTPQAPVPCSSTGSVQPRAQAFGGGFQLTTPHTMNYDNKSRPFSLVAA